MSASVVEFFMNTGMYTDSLEKFITAYPDEFTLMSFPSIISCQSFKNK